MDGEFWKGASIALTGHTGFKGSWLSLWLSHLGADVHGFSNEAGVSGSLFSTASVEDDLSSHTLGDIRDTKAVENFIGETNPDIVIHMAAQSLVRQSYATPLETLTTNIIGTANLLDVCHRMCDTVSIINVTSDKCYQNNETGKAFSEDDPMGGGDIYSASKGAAEIVSQAFAKSFFGDTNIRLANVRAGNVIGGGDWSNDRLLPDFFRAKLAGKPIHIRSPKAVRPWQHVLDPLCGYLALGRRLQQTSQTKSFIGGWNFGPPEGNHQTVQWVIDYLINQYGGEVAYETATGPAEAGLLALDSSKANLEIGWECRWNIQNALEQTIGWEIARLKGADMKQFSIGQICQYMDIAEV